MGWIPVPSFRARDEIHLKAKSGKPLARYFPEIVAVLALFVPVLTFCVRSVSAFARGLAKGPWGFGDSGEGFRPSAERCRARLSSACHYCFPLRLR
jgi:hypothetical protein